MKYRRGVNGESLELASAGPFEQDRQAWDPRRGRPGEDTGHVRRDRVWQHFPGTPPGGQTVSVQPTPCRPHGPAQPFVEPEGIEPCAVQPDICQRAAITGAPQIGIPQAFPALHGHLDWPADPVSRPGRAPGEQRRLQRRQDQDPARQKPRALLGLAPLFAMPFPADPPGVGGVVVRQTIGLHPSRDGRPALGCHGHR